MKSYFMSLFALIISYLANAQSSIAFPNSLSIKPYQIEVTYNKTTNIVFPASILSIDRGSKDIIVEKAIGVNNILRVKADSKDFEETNLSVITNDGKLFSFLVKYSNKPIYLTIGVSEATISTTSGLSSRETAVLLSVLNDRQLANYALLVNSLKSNIHSVNDKTSKMHLSLNGLYVKENAMFFRLRLENYSMVRYDIEQFRLYIRDKRQSQRTAEQEIEITPLYILGDTNSVNGNANNAIVLVIPKFTIPDSKFMVIEIMERNGGRQLAIQIKNRHVVKAKSL